jgi:hypothetical protein
VAVQALIPSLFLTLVVAAALPVRAEEPAPPAPETHVKEERELVDEDGYRVLLSMPTEDDRTAWLKPGPRVDLALEEGRLWGRGPAPLVTTTTAHLRLRMRIDRQWSIGLNAGYSVARGAYTGTRWSAVVEPTFHPLPSLGVSLGIGYGGLDVRLPTAPGRRGQGIPTEFYSRTLGDAEKMYACSGGAWVSQARVEYLWVVGPLFSTGPYLQTDLQWTGCQEKFTNIDRDTGQLAVGRQWWLHRGGALGWWFSWR